jgi:predicted dehydrogenase
VGIILERLLGVTMKKFRAAVIGIGYLGNFHVQKYLALPEIDLVAVVETDDDRRTEIEQKYGIDAYADYHEILDEVDLVSIVVPPDKHFEVARDFLNAGVPVLVEKPVTETVAQAQALINLASRHRCLFQVGHLERFNPAVIALRAKVTRPQFIGAQRFAPYKARGTEVDVVLDLMIHDIDIVLSLVRSEILDISSSGQSVITGDIDIAHARLEFAGGCIAELSASRASQDQVRAMTIRQADSYISVDYMNHQLLVGEIDAEGHADEHKEVSFETHNLSGTDVLMDEIRSFVGAVAQGLSPEVTGEDGKRALEVAIEISRGINEKNGTEAAQLGNL